MCWPRLEGDIEIEERRRKYKNEPRRKRLHFVKDRSSNHSDEWDLIHPRPRSHHDNPEMYQHHQPHQLPFDQRLQVEDPRWAAHLAQQQMHHQPQHHPQMGWRPPQEQIQFHPHHGGGDEIIRVEEFGREHDPHHPHQLPPVVIEREPRVARMPSHVRARSRSRHGGHSRGGSSLFSDESSYGGSHGRGRRRREDVWRDDDSFVEQRRVVPVRRVTTTTRRLN